MCAPCRLPSCRPWPSDLGEFTLIPDDCDGPLCQASQRPRRCVRRCVDPGAVVRSRSRGAPRALRGPGLRGQPHGCVRRRPRRDARHRIAEAATAAAERGAGAAVPASRRLRARAVGRARRTEPAAGEAGRQLPAPGADRSRPRRRGGEADLPHAAVPPGPARPPRTRPHVAPAGRNGCGRYAANTPATLGMHRRTDGLPLHARRHGERSTGAAV